VDQYLDHPSGYLALSPKNTRFSAPERPGFIAYREQGGHRVTFGGVHAAPDDREAILDAFLADAERAKRRVVAIQIREHETALFRSKGFVVNRFGATYGIRLATFALGGARREKLRNKIKRARANGLRVLEVGHEIPRDETTYRLLQDVSAAWLKKKGKKELDFMIGELGTPGDEQRRVFLVQDPAGTTLGFISYVPARGTKPGVLHDLTRRMPVCPPGTMELCNAEAMERLRASGAEWLHFGFTPFFLQGSEGEGASRVLSFAVTLLGRYGGFIYPAKSQVEYKLKWGPDWIESEYIAFRPVSLRAVWDLLRLTRSL